MEDRRSKCSSGNSFSFPTNSNEHQYAEFEFEFGSVTPKSPDSPADHLFFNGRLLPHTFLSPSSSSSNSRLTSRTSSVGSSRSSARTSASDLSHQNVRDQNQKANVYGNKKGCNHLNRSSKRWQFITPAPVLSPEGLSRKKVNAVTKKEVRDSKDPERSSGFGRKILRSIVSACSVCHAMQPAKGRSEEKC